MADEGIKLRPQVSNHCHHLMGVCHVVVPSPNQHQPFANHIRADPQRGISTGFTNEGNLSLAPRSIDAQAMRTHDPRTIRGLIDTTAILGERKNLLQGIVISRINHRLCTEF